MTTKPTFHDARRQIKYAAAIMNQAGATTSACENGTCKHAETVAGKINWSHIGDRSQCKNSAMPIRTSDSMMGARTTRLITSRVG